MKAKKKIKKQKKPWNKTRDLIISINKKLR